MNWYIIIAVIVITILVVLKLRKSAGQPLLTCKISTDNGFDYAIEFHKVHNDLKPIEYVRLLLCFITKMYLISKSKDEDNRTQIRFFLKSIADADNLISGLEKLKGQINIVEEI